jgi:adenine-specific DNA-methyltransferase
MDLWYLFACNGIDMLSNDGHLCFIATNNWITNGGASRNKVISNTQIKKLVDFGNCMIFESASIQTMVMLFSKNNIIDNYCFDYRKLEGDTKLSDVLDLLNKTPNKKAIYLNPNIIRNKFEDKFLTFNPNDNILSKIASSGIYLTDKEMANGIHPHYDFVNNKIARLHNLQNGIGIFGLSDKEKNELEFSETELNLIKPYYTTEQIHRYYSNPQNTLWLIYTSSKFKNPHSMDTYPKLKQHLDRFNDVITSDNKPYGLHRAREERFFKGEKIIVQRKCVGKPSFSYSDFDCYVSATFYVIKTNRFNHKYLLGLLNSKLIAFWLKYKGKMQGDNFQLDKEPLMQIPIKVSDNQQSFISLIENILSEKGKGEDTLTLEREIDKLVYELYGLTEEEIKIIEN